MRDAKLIEPTEVIRLPTEAEWEYCTRAGTTTKYSFGDDPAQLGEYAWSNENAAGNDPPVGAKRPNPWGLYDVHGYLWEFCSEGVVRGGSWKDKAPRLTSDSRQPIGADLKDDAVGFRCVLSAE
jgi:formylglycine-generating enzyme required for sulfatase activity